MFLRRSNPAKEISSIINRAKLAEMKLKVADNIRRENRRRPLNELVIVSALSGMPITYSLLERVYVNAAINDLEKAYRELEKFKKKYVVGRKYSVIPILVGNKIDEAISILKELKSKRILSASDVEEGVEKLASILEGVLSVIEKYEG